jgi:hypothetical protein
VSSLPYGVAWRANARPGLGSLGPPSTASAGAHGPLILRTYGRRRAGSRGSSRRLVRGSRPSRPGRSGRSRCAHHACLPSMVRPGDAAYHQRAWSQGHSSRPFAARGGCSRSASWGTVNEGGCWRLDCLLFASLRPVAADRSPVCRFDWLLLDGSNRPRDAARTGGHGVASLSMSD